ncbi:MAG: sigma-70 family RNA polymerase sigma factor [Planctomycetes bacterium]|nr:sigma-70 family RNA polymerase sigma factor [Planctomycetota bacterium]MCB9904758.1 sigma-70 family RNA polymerase sigma factor [Planctomycetota bacterium]
MTDSTGGGVADLLRAVKAGDLQARDELIALIQPELRKCADRLMRHQPNGHTLQPTALVNEAYLKLFGTDDPHFTDRRHLMATAATAMRQILIDHARRRNSNKRSADGDRIALESVALSYEGNGVDVLAMDEALSSLTEFDPQMARVAELRVFAGLTFEEIAELEDIPLRTLQRKWSAVRAWMMGKMA